MQKLRTKKKTKTGTIMIKRKDGFHGERSVVVPPYIRERLQNDPFLSTLYITDIGYYPHAEHHFVRRSDSINQYVLLYCVSGSGMFSVGDGGRQMPIGENQYVILPVGESHEYCSCEGSPWTIYWIHFAGTLASYYAKDAGMPQTVRPNLESRISDRISLFEEILTVMHFELGDDTLHYASSLLHHFLASLRCIHTYRGVSTSSVSSDIIESAQHYIEENIERHITLSQIAEYVGLSVSNFSMKFRRATGCSPIAYMNRVRMERASELLRTTTMQINQISYKLGINDALYFSRMFRKHTGMSPQEYRAQSCT